MFTRLRGTISVLRYARVEATNHPDVIFVEEKQLEPSRISRAIGAFIGGFILITAVGYIVRLLGHLVSPGNTAVSVSRTTLAAIVGGLLYIFFDRQIHSWIDSVQVRFRITDRLAPFFGHKLEETFRILKG